MKKLFVFLSFWALSISAFSQQHTVSGTVVDENGEGFPGVNIILEGTTTGVVSDFNGSFSIELPKGKNTLVFSMVGYKDRKLPLTVEANMAGLAIGMQPAVESLDEVLVKAVRVDAESPVTHSNMTKEELEDRNLGQDIPILMNFLPAVVTTSDAGAGVGYTGIRVRGSDATRVNVTINGIPYNDAESMGTFWVDLPDFASSVQSLQLQRGVGTSVNGAGAFGASLNILTNTISEKANAEIANSIGSFNTRKHTLNFSTGTLNDHFEIAGRLSRIKSDGYIDRATSDLDAYFLSAAYFDEKTLVKAMAFGGHEITYQAWFGIDAETLRTNRTFNPAGQYTDADGNTRFYDNEVDNYRQDHYQLHVNHKFTENLSATVGLNYTWGRGFFEQYKEDEDFATYGFAPITIGGETINTTDVIRRRWLDNDFYFGNFSLNYKNERLDLVFGTGLGIYRGDHFGEVIWAQYASDSEIRDRYYDNFGDKNDFNVFTKATLDLNDQWSVYGDLQLRTIRYKASGVAAEDVDDSFTFFNPKAGVTYRINNAHSMYFSYARANREPSRTNYENGATDPERLNDFELGWRFNDEKFAINTNVYYMRYKDQLVLTGQLDDVGAPIAENVGDSYRLGLEIDANIQLSDKFIVRPNIAISSNKNIDYVTSRDGGLADLGNTNISFSPNLIAGNIFTYKPTEGFEMSFLSKFVGEQYMGNIDSEVSKLDSYFTNDLNIQYEIKTNSFVKSIVLTGLVNNIFDVEYVSNGYFFTYDDDFSNPGTITTIEGAGFYPQAGINFLLGAALKF